MSKGRQGLGVVNGLVGAVSLCTGCVLLLGGCGGAGTSAGTAATTSGTPVAAVTGVTVSGAAQVRLGATVQFTAALTGGSNSAVTWEVNGVAGGAAATGTISTTGLYTAPAALPAGDTVTVTAVSVAAPALSGAQIESILNPLPIVSTATAVGTGTSYLVDVVGSGFVSGAQIQVAGAGVTTSFLSATELQATVTLAAGTTSVAVGVVNPNPGQVAAATANASVATSKATLASAARLLDQATFGPTLNDIQHVEAVGLNGYLAEQFAMPVTKLPDITTPPPTQCVNTTIPCEQSEWWQTMLTANDQLRLRVAFALSEIFVISTDSVNARSVTPYQNILATDAFGNFATLMKDVALSPGMGAYLNMLHSAKPAAGQIANENFPRELMQLFTTGLYLLNQDGSLLLDVSGHPQPVYTEAQVEAFARAYTGWTYASATGGAPTKFPNYTANFDAPMAAVESAHDMTVKVLLNGTTLPSGQSAEQDLSGALANIFNHPNVGPFVCRQLIQHMVASNPSPAYVGRVAAVFANNGNGVRGDMKAVIAAILMDADARAGDTSPSFDGGHLREPMLYMTDVMRALGFVNVSTTGDWSTAGNYTSALGQKPYMSPSVFNFFPPEYVIPGTTLNAPEFGQENTAAAILRLTLADNLVYNRISGFKVDLSATSALGVMAANPGNLVDSLGVMFLHGQMPAAMRSAIVSNITPLTDMGQRVRVATYLVITSSLYKVEH